MKFKLHSAFPTTLFFVLCLFTGCSPVNTNQDQRFDDDGHLLALPEKNFSMEDPGHVKFYVEVSGSMNGFFRNNVATDFKVDVWNIMSYFAQIAPKITILTNSGEAGIQLSQAVFQKKMNTGAFISSASTRVPIMLETIFRGLNTDNGEVAVLISDMKYSPVGQAAPEVLLAQYSVDIRNILARYRQAVSLIGATSDYYDKQGYCLTPKSPYYFFIIGKEENVAKMRNYISTFLSENGHFIDNIENGFDYGNPKYQFGIPYMCDQMDSEPTFVAYEDEREEVGDTCTINLKIDISDYRWRIANPDLLKNALSVSTSYGSKIKLDNLKIIVSNINDNKIERIAIASVDIKVYNMPMESDVIEWTLALPDTEYGLFNEFFNDSLGEMDPTTSFSLLNFVQGMFYGTNLSKKLKPNYILVSKVNP